MSARDVHLDDLWGSCESLEPDAIRILAHIAKRLVHGSKKYGHITLATDPRSFANEALEEALDLSVYSSIGMLKIVDAEQAEEQRRCALLNQFATMNRTAYIVRADDNMSVPEPPTAES